MKKVITEEEIEFLKHSNYIEGEYSESALEDAKKAWLYIRDKKKIKYSDILRVHSILMIRLNPRIAGEMRHVSVMVGGHIMPNPESAYYQLLEWIEEINNMDIKDTDVLMLREYHVNFENIHPFEDGNGRVGRILYNWSRLRIGLPIYIIHHGSEQLDYYKWFKRI